MAYPPSPPSSTGSIATSPPISFDHYVHYAGKAAELAREAILQLPSLQQRLKQLESELEVWKLGHSEASQRAKDAQKQLDQGDNMVACFLDGDGCIFDRSLIKKGRDGGREAALALRSNITNYAEREGVQGELTVVVTLFLSKYGLAKALQSNGIADEQTFSAFLQGLNAAHPLIQVTDVGPQKEAADAKLRENIKLYSKLPSCKLVLAGCSHDGGYAHMFTTLQTESPLISSKLRLLHSYDGKDTAFELKRLNLDSIQFEGLFERRKLGSYSSYGMGHGGGGSGTGGSYTNGGSAVVQPVLQRRSTPVSMIGNGGTGTTPGKKKSYINGGGNTSGGESNPLVVVKDSTKVIKLQPIDPSKPLNKQSEPLCNAYYLSPPCTSGDQCKYSHNYLLTPAQLVQLRSDARKSPCMYALKGKVCKDVNCFAGHVCPHGKACRYGLSCRFAVPGMHPPGTKGRNDGGAWKGGETDVSSKPIDPDQRSILPIPSSTPRTRAKSARKKLKGQQRLNEYVARLGSLSIVDAGDRSASEEDESSEDESGFETTSSID